MWSFYTCRVTVAPRHVAGLCAFALTVGALGGCASDGRPRYRMGMLPFPGALSMYMPVEAEQLGHHRYDHWHRDPFGKQCLDRGILYTCRAGFLDVAHVRTAADWTRYSHGLIQEAFENSSPRVSFKGPDGGRYELVIFYPPGWGRYARDDATTEYAVRLAQHVSCVVLLWHEVATWYGQRTVFLISEAGSAFTCDDIVSHMVGAEVAGRALRRPELAYDDAVTEELVRELDALGARPLDVLQEAARAVEGVWWSGVEAKRRHLDSGIDGRPVVPWIVEGLAACEGAAPNGYQLPPLHDIMGRDYSRMCQILIRPQSGPMRRIYGSDQPRPAYLRADTDLPAIIEQVRQEILNAYGPDADKPYPPAASIEAGPRSEGD